MLLVLIFRFACRFAISVGSSRGSERGFCRPVRTHSSLRALSWRRRKLWKVVVKSENKTIWIDTKAG